MRYLPFRPQSINNMYSVYGHLSHLSPQPDQKTCFFPFSETTLSQKRGQI